MTENKKSIDDLVKQAYAALDEVNRKESRIRESSPEQRREELRQNVTKAFVYSFIALIFLAFFVVLGRPYVPSWVDHDQPLLDQMLKDLFAIVQFHLAVLNLVLGYYFGSREKGP